MLTHCSDPRDAAELLLLRENMRGWRFYDHFRTDSEAPARRRQIGTRTPVLASRRRGSRRRHRRPSRRSATEDELAAAVADAFPGGSIDVNDDGGYFEIEMRQHGLLRPLERRRAVGRHAALSSAGCRPAVAATADADDPERAGDQPASRPAAGPGPADRQGVHGNRQIIVVSHAQSLVSALQEAGAKRIVLEKQLGETVVPGEERPVWNSADALSDVTLRASGAGEVPSGSGGLAKNGGVSLSCTTGLRCRRWPNRPSLSIR